MAKYKVGDKVRIVTDSSIDTWPDDMMDWAGKVMTILEVYRNIVSGAGCYRMEEDRSEGFPGRYWYEFMISGLAEPEQKPYTVELRFDGMITTATLKRGGRDVKTAEARCKPTDTYSRAEGARVAVERLFEKKRKENKPKVGDKFVVTGNRYRPGHAFPAGTIVTLEEESFPDNVYRFGTLTQYVNARDTKPYKENAK